MYLHKTVTARPPLAPQRRGGLYSKPFEMGFTRTLAIFLIGVVIPLVMIVIVLIGHTRSTPLSPLHVTRDAIEGVRL